MAINMAQFHKVYFEESFEGLDIMESGLLRMDPGAVDLELINAVFRAAHSIKGGGGTFGFSDISSFTHLVETLLDEMREGARTVTAELITALLGAIDTLREMLQAAQEGGQLDEAQVDQRRAELDQILSAPQDKIAEQQTETTAAGAESVPVGWHILFRPLPHMMHTGNDPLRILRELADLGDLQMQANIEAVPRLAELEAEDCYLAWDLQLHGDVSREAVDQVFSWVEDDCELTVTPILQQGEVPGEENTTGNSSTADAEQKEQRAATGSSSQTAQPKTSGNGNAAAAVSGSIRVDTEKIDFLINMVGELVITQSMLSVLGEDFHIGRMERLKEGLAQLDRHTRELQESVMQIRMLPIRFAFSRFPRLVHDLSAKLGKKVELSMSGEETEVDKSVIEKIGDPLVHLVRNSLDHGIELPKERLQAGKLETGKIELKAMHRGGSIVIEIQDDGKGLDRERILDIALKRGLVNEEHNLTDKQVYELIFQPGFSTAEQVSDVSGRGVGMDVVLRNISELGGNIEIESEAGLGSTITIRLPLTLAIMDGQIVSCGDETYIVPLASIIESIQVRPDMINLVAGRAETFKLRDEYLPIIRLHKVFGIEEPKARRLTEGLLVVVESDIGYCGLFVDDLVGQQQVVVKSIEANYEKVNGISGATILGDGSVALILDIPSIVRLALTDDKEQELRKQIA
jgi:two-component system chemotaxis sensor kinase CheA